MQFFLTAFLLIFFYLRFRNVFLKHPELVLRNVYQVESTKFAIITIIFSAHQSVLKWKEAALGFFQSAVSVSILAENI